MRNRCSARLSTICRWTHEWSDISRRSAVTCWPSQRALSLSLALAASRKRPSFGLRSVGAWMRIAATDSRGGRGPTGTLSAVVSLITQPVSHGVPARFFRVIENVVLIDEADAALGEGEKLDVHPQGKPHPAVSLVALKAAGGTAPPPPPPPPPH